jgi:catechol 1,2-dioxygenase
MNRKKFLGKISFVAIGLSIFGKVKANDNKTFSSDCTTTNDILGPFYRPNAPLGSDLLYKGIKGTVITLEGQVFSDCDTALKEAQIEIWHCNTTGEYDNESSKYQQRGRFITKEDGTYKFQTIFPGKYLNGKLYRPAHIHLRVTAPKHQELISQIYFAGDPHIESDHWASQKKAISRILPISPIGIAGSLSIKFNIHLRQNK